MHAHTIVKTIPGNNANFQPHMIQSSQEKPYEEILHFIRKILRQTEGEGEGCAQLINQKSLYAAGIKALSSY